MRIWIDPGGEPINPAGSIEFTAPAFVGREGGLATVTVERRSGAEGDVAVAYRTAPPFGRRSGLRRRLRPSDLAARRVGRTGGHGCP